MGDVADAVEFLRACFDAAGEVVAGRPAETRIGDSLVVVSDASERQAFPALLYVYVDDADDTYRASQWGNRQAIIEDKHGNVFQAAHRRS